MPFNNEIEFRVHIHALLYSDEFWEYAAAQWAVDPALLSHSIRNQFRSEGHYFGTYFLMPVVVAFLADTQGITSVPELGSILASFR